MRTTGHVTESDRTLATTIPEPRQLDEKYHFLLRKLHSLTGIVPLGVFLCEHMLTNSMAYFGKAKFNDSVHFLHDLPYLLALEVFGIFLPLAFHVIYGIKIALSGRSNVTAYAYFGNWRYLLQRLTGFFAFVFLVVHLLKFRFAHWFGGPEFVGCPDPFQLTLEGLLSWGSDGGLTTMAWVTLVFYWVGLVAVCFHFANGIWGFCITWGITIGKKAQQRVGVLAALIGVVLFFWGILSLSAFVREPKPRESAPERIIVDRSPRVVEENPRGIAD